MCVLKVCAQVSSLCVCSGCVSEMGNSSNYRFQTSLVLVLVLRQVDLES
jgi:hypothetical protein